MRVVLDTNVLISAIFFGGKPRDVLLAWTRGELELVLTPRIFAEYQAVCERLAEKRPGIVYAPVLSSVLRNATMIEDEPISDQISSDPDDDKFLVAARSAGAIVVSGDSDLSEMDGWEGVVVLSPADLLRRM